MKRLIIPFVAAFGLSLGVATGVVIMKAPKAPASTAALVAGAPKASDSTAAAKGTVAPVTHDSVSTPDSAQVAGGSVGEPKPVTPTATPTAASAKTGAPVSTVAANATLASTATAARKPGPPPARPISDSLIGRRLAQVFAAMQPKDAARVLEQMDDNDVRAILGSLPSKQQAAILGSFPTQRAALIVQNTLRTGATGGTE